MGPGLPLPVLTLRLSSPSFLETVFTDAGNPLYSTETEHNSTSLYRCHPLLGLTLVANIRWPEYSPKGKSKELPPAHVLMDGFFKSERDLLRTNVLNTSRKFHIPGHSHALKWKRLQGIFQCMSSCGAVIAMFEPAILTAPPRLSVFVQSLSGLPDAQGDAVSNILIDYLIVTALLLLTHREDWRGFAPTLCLQIPHDTVAPSYSTPVSPITSACSDTPSSSLPYEQYDRTPLEVDDTHQMEFKDVVREDYEPPPPYEEIQWTVRIPQRRARCT